MERLCVCLRVLSEQSPLMAEVFGEQSRSVFAKMLHIREQEASADKKVILRISPLIFKMLMVLEHRRSSD